MNDELIDPTAPMCACGHTLDSHSQEGCFGCDGPPCDLWTRQPLRSHFEREAELKIVEHTNYLLNALDRIALRYDVDKANVEAACRRFSGEDLADCWLEFVGEAEL